MSTVGFRYRRFLIFGGTTKAGTTSLYSYFASHPEIIPSSCKETRFFMDDDYPVPFPGEIYSGNNLDSYAEYFSNCSDESKIFMEATPDYLYSRKALSISELLPQAKMVFVLRDPIDRLRSWFGFAKRMGMMKNSVTFEYYVKMQMEGEVVKETPWLLRFLKSKFGIKVWPERGTPMHLRALEQGSYFKYLTPFLSRMGDNVLVVPFEELKAHPCEVAKRICRFAGIDPFFFDSYAFNIKNKTFSVRYQTVEIIYIALRRKLLYLFRKKGQLFSFFQRLNSYVKKILKFNQVNTEKVIMSADIIEALERYYAPDFETLQSYRKSWAGKQPDM